MELSDVYSDDGHCTSHRRWNCWECLRDYRREQDAKEKAEREARVETWHKCKAKKCDRQINYVGYCPNCINDSY